MKIRVKNLKKKQTVPEEIEDLFFNKWEANKHNLSLEEEDYNLALFYYNAGFSVGFRERLNVKKKVKENKCIHCGTRITYSEKYDARYCPKCLYWTERICPNRKCKFCNKRPKYPRRNQKKND